MLTPTTIRNAMDRANELSYYYADLLIQDNEYGEGDPCCQLKIYVLNRWAVILNNYLNQNFDENDNIKTPDYSCNTAAEIHKLIGKINSVKC